MDYLLRYRALLKPSDVLYLAIRSIMYLIIALGLFLLIKEMFYRELSFENLVKNTTIRVLELVILYEIFRAVLSIFEYQRVKLTFLVDACISFMIRELIIVIYSGKLNPELSLSLGAVLLVLALLRIVVVRFSPEVKHEV
ncbi:MAG: hypothetical protein D6674_06370 [Acidobacteria bacterium]|nr:MAG: hypothetical protein D6674_06370 [Acidobacteriota bacterium]